MFLLPKKDRRSLIMNLLGFTLEEISTFGQQKKGVNIYIDPNLIENITAYWKYENGIVSKMPNDGLLKNVIIHLMVIENGKRIPRGYRCTNWVEDRTFKIYNFSKNRIFGFSGSPNVVLEITFLPKAFL